MCCHAGEKKQTQTGRRSPFALWAQHDTGVKGAHRGAEEGVPWEADGIEIARRVAFDHRALLEEEAELT